MGSREPVACRALAGAGTLAKNDKLPRSWAGGRAPAGTDIGAPSSVLGPLVELLAILPFRMRPIRASDWNRAAGVSFRLVAAAHGGKGLASVVAPSASPPGRSSRGELVG